MYCCSSAESIATRYPPAPAHTSRAWSPVRVAFVQKRYQDPSWYCVLVPLHAESAGASGGTVPKEINRWFAGPPCHVHHSSIVAAV